MKILKTKTFFTYLVVGALVMALYVSCKSNENPVDEEKVGENPPAGEYSSPLDGKAIVTHNGNGCTISATLRGSKLTGSTYTYQTNDFNITVNSWRENSDGNGSIAQEEEQFTLDKCSMSYISWNYTDSGNVAIHIAIEYDSFIYVPSLTN